MLTMSFRQQCDDPNPRKFYFMQYIFIITRVIRTCTLPFPVSYPSHLAHPPRWDVHIGILGKKSGSPKTRIMEGLSDSEDNLTIVEPFGHNTSV